jgi:long-chain acyl-CoA synthetase
MTEHIHPWIRSYDEGLDWAMPVGARPVFSMLDETVAKHPGSPAFDFLGKVYTWQEIGVLADKFAAGLQAMGVEKGAKIGLFLPNTPYYLVAYYGILKAGGTVVNFNPLYAHKELAHQIEDSETDIMVTADLSMLYDKMHKMLHDTRLRHIVLCRFTDILPFPKNKLFATFKAKEIARVDEHKRMSWFHEMVNNDGQVKVPEINPEEDIAVLQYTGGTTGVPKGAMLTHANVYANTVQSLSWFPEAQAGVHKMLGVLPFFHVFAMTAVMNLSVMAGFEIIALPRFELKEALKIIHKKKPHFFPAVPAIYSAINHYHHLKRYDLSSLEYCISGGAPLPVEVKKKFESITGCVVVEGYGLSETSPVVCVNPVRGENIAGSIGLPVPQTIVEIVNSEDKQTLMSPGERGELCVRGPQVMKGYWKKPQETAEILRVTADGGVRLHTGDVAIMDERGYVFIVDRIKDMIITNGYNVYPRNVEEAIYQHPGVEECVVAGLPDKQRGEVVKVWIKLKQGREVSAEDLKEFLKDKISPMEIPRLFEFRDQPLPKTMIGKLSRKELVAGEKAKY